MTVETEMTATENDPFNGYASCPDKCRIYISQSDNNQKMWLQESQSIIREFINKINTFKDFYTAYAYLAHKRHEVAILLQHKAAEGKTNYFGTFRKEGDHFRKNITAGDGEEFWKWQKNKIFELVQELIAPIKQMNERTNDIKSFYEDKYKTCIKEIVVVDNMHADYYSATVKFPVTEMDSKNLSIIELYEFAKHPNNNLIRIEYTPINHDTMQLFYKILNEYYKYLIGWRVNDGVEEFLVVAAKLSYLLAHMLPVKQGNVAVVEWMLRAIAFKNGIELGCFNLQEKISWDFKAVLTANQNEYIKWYVDKLFIHVAIIDNRKKSDIFSFTG